MCDCICGETFEVDTHGGEDIDELLDLERRMLEEGEKTYLDCLIETGMRIPPPEELDDGTLRAKLWEVIAGLARLRVFIESTDHLSDRLLYRRLYAEVLREHEWAVHIGTYDLRIAMTDAPRDDPFAMWLGEVLDREPPGEQPRFDRDRHLPQPEEDDVDGVA
ncbi:MAG: hypothetical protein JOZ54_07700 [Acidobacteria bacterium]|nr:hypothetical protein [Acidobacteriota bacterium]